MMKNKKIFKFLEGVDMLNLILCMIGEHYLVCSLTEEQNQY